MHALSSYAKPLPIAMPPPPPPPASRPFIGIGARARARFIDSRRQRIHGLPGNLRTARAFIVLGVRNFLCLMCDKEGRKEGLKQARSVEHLGCGLAFVSLYAASSCS